MGRVEVATLVDHIEPHRGDDELFWSTSNWQSSCTWHHSSVKQKLEQMHFMGQIDKADLRLDSEKAKFISRNTPRKAPIGVDGWPQ